MNQLKQLLLSAFTLLALSLSVGSCSDSDDDESSAVTATVSATSMTFTKAAETQKLYVLASSTPTISSSESWCTATYVSVTTLGTYTYNISVTANSDTDERTATLTVTVGSSFSATVDVTQSQEDGLVVGQTTYDDIPAAGQEITLSLSSNGDYAYSIDVSWITASTTRAMTTESLTFVVGTNTGTARTGTITFTLNDLSAEVTVNQLAGESNTISGDTPAEIAASMGLGWNLGNQLDAHDNGVAEETAWGNAAATQTTFDCLAEAGFTTIRIPVTWMGHIGDAPTYTIDSDWLDRVYEVVGYAEQAGLNAIINIHHDGADSAYWLDIASAFSDEDTNTSIKEELAALWTQIAEKFADKGDFLMFEAMNEIQDGSWSVSHSGIYAILNEWNQTFVDAVRATGGNNATRYLGVPGYSTNIDYTVAGFELPDDTVDNRLLVAVHYYDPYNYTLGATVSEWGHTGTDTDGWGDEDYLVGQLEKMKTNFIDQGIPAYIGEIGCVRRGTTSGEAFRQYYLEYLCKACKDYSMCPMYWDNGYAGSGSETSGLISHSTGEWLNDDAEAIVEVMKRAIFTEDESYTLETVYDTAP